MTSGAGNSGQARRNWDAWGSGHCDIAVGLRVTGPARQDLSVQIAGECHHLGLTHRILPNNPADPLPRLGALIISFGRDDVGRWKYGFDVEDALLANVPVIVLTEDQALLDLGVAKVIRERLAYDAELGVVAYSTAPNVRGPVRGALVDIFTLRTVALAYQNQGWSRDDIYGQLDQEARLCGLGKAGTIPSTPQVISRRRVLDAVRHALEGIEPHLPVDVDKLAGNQRAVIHRTTHLPSNIAGDLRRTTNLATIRVRDSDPRQRQRFTAMHELAHLMLEHSTETVCFRDRTLNTGESPQEDEADAFAAEVLMPYQWVYEEYAKVSDRLDTRSLTIEEIARQIADKLASRFDVSVTAMQRRLRDLGLYGL